MVRWRLLSPCLGILRISLGIPIFLARRLGKIRYLRGVPISLNIFECFFVTLVIFPVWLKRLCVAHDCFFRFHEFLKLENEVGNMTRQEAVSMVCSLMLY